MRNQCFDPRFFFEFDFSINPMWILFCCMQVESAVKPLLDEYFPQQSGVQVLAQPGNFYVASAFSLAVNVIGKKIVNRHWNSLSQGNVIYSVQGDVVLFHFVSIDIITKPQEVKALQVYSFYIMCCLSDMVTKCYIHRREERRYRVPVLHEWRCLWPIQPQVAGKPHCWPISAQG